LLPQATQVRWRRKPTGLAAWRSDDAIVEMIAERIRLQPRFVPPRLEEYAT
jgi:hypothetical protein